MVTVTPPFVLNKTDRLVLWQTTGCPTHRQPRMRHMVRPATAPRRRSEKSRLAIVAATRELLLEREGTPGVAKSIEEALAGSSLGGRST